MQSLLFWKNWPKDYRWLWYSLTVIFIFSILLLWVYYFQGTGTVIDWEKIQEQKVIETTIHSFRLGPFQLAIPSESYVIFEYLAGSDLHHNLTASYIFITTLILSAIVLLALITTLERFWYFVGMSLFILFLISLRLDVLQLFNLSGYTIPVMVLVLFLIPAFYFKYVRTESSFIVRGATFAAITFVLAIVVALFSPVEIPIAHLVVTAYTPAMILCTLFIIMVAHEILVSFVYITNQATTGNNINHFSIISFIYLVYIIITCLHEVGVIHWNFVYVNLYLLLTLSSILGIWGFRIREPQFENIFPFHPFGAMFYLALGTICFVTIAHQLGNANDSALAIIRYVIIFSHAGFGIIFVLYFLSNFIGMMSQNIPVYNLLYRPNRMPYFTFRFAGLIASLAFLFYSNWRDFVGHGIAGFYNYVGDMHLLQGNEAYAITFYEQSKSRSFQNHRANYALATLKTSRLDFTGAQNNYKLANGKRPTEFSLVNGGNLNLWAGRNFDAIAYFKDGEKRVPASAAIQNNLGYCYSKVHALDSASYYMTAARQRELTKNSAETNFLAMAATELIPIDTDSVLTLFDSRAPAVSSNAMALAMLFDQDVHVQTDPLANKRLNLYTATFLNNYINRNAKTLDTAFIQQAYRIASDSLNDNYNEALKASLAHAYYHQGNVYKGMEILAELAYRTQSYGGKYNYIMGLWALEQQATERAASFFSHAEVADYKQAQFYHAIALTESGRTSEALMAWDTLISKGDEAIVQLAIPLKKVLQINPENVLELSDPEKYQFCRYRIGLRDSMKFQTIVRTFSDDSYRAQAILDYAMKFYEADKLTPAIKLLNQISGLEIGDEKLYEDITQFDLLLLASRRDIETLASKIKEIKFQPAHKLHQLLYTALIHESAGETVLAEKKYELLSKSNPYFEEAILAAANYFRNKDVKSLKSYNLLVEAIYVNPQSIRLLKAYAVEASRMGFEEYASSAVQRLMELEQAAY